MAKKVKCIDCINSMHWALPVMVRGENLEYAKYCSRIAKRSIVCGETMKTKQINHEQYCKKYREKTEWDKEYDKVYDKEISELEKKIEDYEHQTDHKQIIENFNTM